MPHDFWGLHWQREHPDDRWDGEYIRRFQPVSIKLFMKEWTNQMFCDWLLSVAPAHTYFVIRDHGLSEQKQDMYTAPDNTGQRHAREFAQKIREGRFHLPPERCYFEGINEPETNSHFREINTYWVAFINEGIKHGIRASAFSFGTGHPSTVDRRPDTPVDYSHYSAAIDALLKHGGHLNIHLYGAANNIAVPGHLTRWSNCPWPVPVDITEFGVDAGVVKGGDIRGYKAFDETKEPAAYVDYLDRQQQTARNNLGALQCKSIEVFTFDHAQPWGTFDIRKEVAELMAARASWLQPRTQPQPSGTDSTGHLPIVSKPGPTQPKQLPQPKEIDMGIIEPRAAAAVLDVESGGRGFGQDGRLLIRFETHIFKARLGNDGLFGRHFQQAAERPWASQQHYRRSESEPWQPIHTGNQDSEWAAFDLARSLHAEAAYLSISMGAAQIVGFNAQRVGYPSAQAMFTAFSRSMGHQMVGFFNYILSDPDLYRAMTAHDWRTIARLYNGTGSVDLYAGLLQAAYNKV